MRINLERIKIEYQDDRFLNLAFHIPGQEYPTRIRLEWKQWDFACLAMDRNAPLNIGDFALTDGVLRHLQFFSDAIRIHNLSEGHDSLQTMPFPFEALRDAIRDGLTEIGPEEIERLRLRHWPHSRVIWDGNVDKSVVFRFHDLILPHVRGLRNIARNYSNGELCVVHMYKDGSNGWKPEQIERGERPSFYWVIRRYVKLAGKAIDDLADWRSDNPESDLRSVFLYGHKYVADTNLVYKTEYYIDYGRIMVGGLIWHPNYKDPTTGSYGVHT